jgi:hypothetical protein
VQQDVVEHEDGHDTVELANGAGERLMIGDPQVAPVPETVVAVIVSDIRGRLERRLIQACPIGR